MNWKKKQINKKKKKKKGRRKSKKRRKKKGEGNQKKNYLSHLAGLEPATFRLTAERANRLRHKCGSTHSFGYLKMT